MTTMKRVLSLFLVVAAAVAQAASTGPVIYIFDVGQAMSQLILFPSGFSVLLDAPENAWQSSSTSDMLSDKLSSILGGKKHIDVAVPSHMHLDHMGYASIGGIYALIEKHGFSFGKVVDRDSGKWVDRNGDGNCTADELVWKNMGDVSGTAVQWVCYATDPRNTRIYGVRETVRLCATDQIAPPDPLAKVTVIAADAAGALMKDGKTPVSGDHSAEHSPPSENDYSIGVLVEYGPFSYATLGDLDGEYFEGAFGYVYDDVESTVIHRVGAVDLHNVDHHGSAHSSNAAFLKQLQPTVAVISCGRNNSFQHPDQKTLDTLAAVGSNVFITEDGNPTAKYGTAVIANGDIVATVSSTGKTFEVSVPGKDPRRFNSRGTVHPKCKL